MRNVFTGACCDKLQVHSKEKEAFSHSKYVGDFLFKETPEGDPVVCNEAAVFAHANGKLFLYRNKDGDWCVGKYLTEIISTSSHSPSPGGVVGNNKKAVYLRSQDPDRSSFIQECPCQVLEQSHLTSPLT